ncbi:MAG: hypothetical protein ABIU63_16240 [Chitinophagaceae bacterium]
MEKNQEKNLLKVPVAPAKISYRQIADTLQNPLEILSQLTKK